MAGKQKEERINVPKLIAAHAHEDNPQFTPRQQRAIMAWMKKTAKAHVRRRRKEGSRGK